MINENNLKNNYEITTHGAVGRDEYLINGSSGFRVMISECVKRKGFNGIKN